MTENRIVRKRSTAAPPGGACYNRNSTLKHEHFALRQKVEAFPTATLRVALIKE
jgi:hypothetical protein